MSGTPRLRSSYPSTPASGQRTQQSRNSPQNESTVAALLPNVPGGAPISGSLDLSPMIPVGLVDAPTQRLSVLSVYAVLVAWCIYDWWTLVEEDTQSMGLFMKWICIFATFSYGVPQLRIPWLEWSPQVSNLTFGAHAIISFLLMFRIPVRLAYVGEDDHN